MTFVRFAPSPTGRLHVGNARVALINWLFARKTGGKFMLRIDDTDTERSRQEYIDGVKEDLTWLGLNWDCEAQQSKRFDNYHQALQALKDNGRLYPCYETQEELDIKRKIQLSQKKPPIYDRSAMKLTTEQKAAFEAQGRKPHWRFKIEPGEIGWNDLIRGPIQFMGENLSDPILVKEDGGLVYTTASVVDDGEFGITHVLRGEDHIANTAIHIQIFEALGYTPPQFGHFSLFTMADGSELSKRLGSLSLKTMREEDDVNPLAITSFLSRLGTSDPIQLRGSLDEMMADFDFAKFSRSSAKFDVEELKSLNVKILHQMSFAEIQPRLIAAGLTQIDADFWDAIRHNLTKFSDIQDWWVICRGEIDVGHEDAEFLRAAAALLPQGQWNEATWKEWTKLIQSQTGRKGKELFMPLRMALTGMDHGPELGNLLPLIGRDVALKRLKAA